MGKVAVCVPVSSQLRGVNGADGGFPGDDGSDPGDVSTGVPR